MRTQAMTADATRNGAENQTGLPARAGCPFAAIARWHATRDAASFPYEAVIAAFQRVGKHLVAPELLEALAGVRAALAGADGSAASVRLLERFLDNALDKWDGRYANPTYLGLSLLPLPSIAEHGDDVGAAERKYDCLLVQLAADVMRFEIAAADGGSAILPQMPADERIVAKRCRLGLQIVGPAARRLGWYEGVDEEDAIAGARRLVTNLASILSAAERHALEITMLPVSLIHDEYQFIRVLQSFEATFALAAVLMHAAVRALAEGESEVAVGHIERAERGLHEAAPLFSLVATMRVEAFHTFREFTEGASAIQSRNYKLMESLCRRPEQERLDAAAYRSVPEVRERVLAGQATLDDAIATARASGCLEAGGAESLQEAMERFAATLLRWRRTHHGLATRMLGERTGTGYSEGAAYLKAVMAIPVFSSLRPEAGSDEMHAVQGGEVALRRDVEGARASGRCPFAGGASSFAMAAVAG